MKRSGLFVVAMIFVGFFLNSCATTHPEIRTQYFSQEWFLISIENFNSVPEPTDYTFEAVLSVVESLRRHSAGHLFYDTADITEDELLEILAQGGFSQEDIYVFMHYAENAFLIFEYLPDNNYYIIMYFERL